MNWKNQSSYINMVVYLFCIIFVILPFFWFWKDLFIGGDDTRLFYLFPIEWIKNIGSYAWTNFSWLGSANPQYFVLPFLFLIAPFQYFGIPSYIIQNILIGALLSWGFYFLYKFFLKIIGNDFKVEALLSSLFFVLSPIIYINQIKVFLYPVWLIFFVPLLLYLSSYYVFEWRKSSLLFIFFSGVFWSIAFSQIPWVLGLIIPLLVFFIFFKKKIFIKILIILITLLWSQLFWLLPFLFVSFSGWGFVSEGVLTSEINNTFYTTVEAVSRGNTIINPLLNNFNYGLFSNFGNPIKMIFDEYYNYTIYFSLVFFVLPFVCLLYKNSIKNYKLYLSLFALFLLILFLFVARIWIFYNIFLWFGQIPWFVMFRNFFDKFAISFVLIYSFLILYSLVLVRTILRKGKKIYNIIIFSLFFAIFINAIPLFSWVLLQLPLWTTKTIKTNVKIPQEYKDFMSKIRKYTDPNGRILMLPYGISSYSYSIWEESNTIFQGRSPVELFSQRQDFSGRFSLWKDRKKFEQMLLERNYEWLKKILNNHAVKYIIYFPTLPNDFLKSYLFDSSLLEKQDQIFFKNIVWEKIIESSSGNYILLNLKDSYWEIISSSSTGMLILDRSSPVKYNISLFHLSGVQNLDFKDTFSRWWNLLLNNEPIFEETHHLVNDYANGRTIDVEYIKKNFPKDYYKENPDGSIDINLTLYFKPQSYFYVGLWVSGVTLLILLFLLAREHYLVKNNEK